MARLIATAAAAVVVAASASTPSLDDGQATMTLHERWSPSEDYPGYGEKSSDKWWRHRHEGRGEDREEDDEDDYYGSRHKKNYGHDGHGYDGRVDRFDGYPGGHSYEGHGDWDRERHGEGRHPYDHFADGEDEGPFKWPHHGDENGHHDGGHGHGDEGEGRHEGHEYREGGHGGHERGHGHDEEGHGGHEHGHGHDEEGHGGHEHGHGDDEEGHGDHEEGDNDHHGNGEFGHDGEDDHRWGRHGGGEDSFKRPHNGDENGPRDGGHGPGEEGNGHREGHEHRESGHGGHEGGHGHDGKGHDDHGRGRGHNEEDHGGREDEGNGHGELGHGGREEGNDNGEQGHGGHEEGNVRHGNGEFGDDGEDDHRWGRHGRGDGKDAAGAREPHGWSEHGGDDERDDGWRHKRWSGGDEEDDPDYSSQRHGWGNFGGGDDDGKDSKKEPHDSNHYGSGHTGKHTKPSYDDNAGGRYSPRRRHSKPNSNQHPSDSADKNTAQELREDTEAFVNDAFQWVNGIVGQETASSLFVDTSFSLTKSAETDLGEASCGSGPLSKLFPVLRKFVDHPQTVNLLDNDVQAIAWTPLSVCSSKDGNAEFEGGIYGSFRVACADHLLLNVSIASSGATPTIKGQQIEDRGLYINVDVLDGTIVASDAFGSIVGTLKNRHFPENADEVLKNWTATIQACAVSRQLSVDGVVGGGWTQYKSSEKAGDGFQASVVGYAESFSLSFPESAPSSPPSPPTETTPPAETTPPTPAPEEPAEEPAATPEEPTGEPASSSSSGSAAADATVTFPPGSLRANAVPDPIVAAVEATAAGAASAYVESGILCVQPATAHLSCGGKGVLAQLSSFYERASASHASRLARRRAASALAPLAALALVAAACVAFAMTTLRRRNGYEPLAGPV